MRKTGTTLAVATALLLGTMSVALGAVNTATPSTNDANEKLGWAHFVVLATRAGEVDIEFVNPRGFPSCFEHRSDGEAPDYEGALNPNPQVYDGLWHFVCVNNGAIHLTLDADAYVEIRMVFGAESDERFDWTRVDVTTAQPPGYHGLQNAKSGPAGERANENARFNR